MNAYFKNNYGQTSLIICSICAGRTFGETAIKADKKLKVLYCVDCGHILLFKKELVFHVSNRPVSKDTYQSGQGVESET